MNKTEITKALTTLGWRVRDDAEYGAAVRDFQRAWCLGPALLVDGKPGRATQQALTISLTRNRAGQPDASEHFAFREFICKCGGRFANCRRIRLHRGLLSGLEKMRAAYGKPITIVSGYRCPSYNQKVGGASSSQHVYGAAADVNYVLHRTAVRRLRIFAGIGRSKSTSMVRHVDRRDVSGNNTTQGTVDQPTEWVYAN